MAEDQLAVKPEVENNEAAVPTGAADNVKELIATELTDVPEELLALTRYWYSVPGLSPEIVCELPVTLKLLKTPTNVEKLVLETSRK